MIRTAMLSSAFLVPFLVVSVGCHKNAPPPKTPEPVATTAPTASAPAYVPPKNPAVNMSDDIMRACNIVVNNVEEAPKFNFDSAELSNAEKDVLTQVAKCVTTGALKGRSLQLVGRADPRGEQEYNMELGVNRAASVKHFLTGLGVDGAKVSLTSRGKLDAVGTDEAGWQKDRRVDVNLQK